MLLEQVARIPAVAATPDTTVLQAIRLMASNEVGAVVVTDPFGKIAGIFTERDNMLRVTLLDRDPKNTLLKDVMTAVVKTALPDLPAQEALQHMIRHKHRHLPVVDAAGRVIGVVSLRQLLMKRLSEQNSDIETLAAMATAGGPG